MKLEKQPSGSWLETLANNLIEKYDLELHILVLGAEKKNYTTTINRKTYHYRYSCNGAFKDTPKVQKTILEVIEKVSPDLIDFQGIEFHYCKYIDSDKINIPIVSTIQGLTSEIYKYTTGNLSFLELIMHRTLKDWLLFDGLIERKYKYYRRAVSEVETIKNNKYFIGRTFWDKSKILSINKYANYYHCEHEIRSEFFGLKWKHTNAEPYTIFISQSHTAFKGLHILLKAVNIVKNTYPQVKIKIAGTNILRNDSFLDWLKSGTYSSFLRNLIRKLELTDSIEFLGVLNGKEMGRELVSAHCYVLPSLIENSPVSLSEAQVIGTPSIAAFVGGCPESIKHNYDGYLYNSVEAESLAFYIQELFSDMDKCELFSSRSRDKAHRQFKGTDATKEAYNIYSDILGNFNPSNIKF